MNNAYVNLIYNDDDNDFINILVSINSLIKSKTSYDLILLYTLDVPQYKINILKKYFTKIIRVEYILPKNKLAFRFGDRIKASCTKFAIFNLIEYNKIIYISNQLFINKNIDKLFQNKVPSGIIYKNKNSGKKELANTSILIIKPSENIYNKLLDNVDNFDNIKNIYKMDIDILNIIFHNWYYIDNKYNFNYLIKEYKEDIPYLEKNLFITDFNFIETPNLILYKLKMNILEKNKKFHFYKLLYTQWFQIYIHLYNQLKKKDIYLNDLYGSIIEHNYEKYLKTQYPRLKILKLNHIQTIKLNKELNKFIDIDKKYTYNQIINYLVNNNVPIFSYGGSIRALYNNEKISDIDLLYIGNYKKIFSLLQDINDISFKQGGFKKYFYIGKNKELDLMNIDVLKNVLNAPCNGVLYDFSNKKIYDLSGIGIKDIENKVWRMVPTNNFNDWSVDLPPRILRLEKFLSKKFNIPEKDKINIYNDIYYSKKDRSYWGFFKSKINDDFYDIIEKDVSSLKLPYSGKELVDLIKKHV
jgi:hypothetical protein